MREYKNLKRVITIGYLGFLKCIRLEYLEKDSEGNYNIVFWEHLKDQFGNIVFFIDEESIETVIEKMEKEDKEKEKTYKAKLENDLKWFIESETE